MGGSRLEGGGGTGGGHGGVLCESAWTTESVDGGGGGLSGWELGLGFHGFLGIEVGEDRIFLLLYSLVPISIASLC